MGEELQCEWRVHSCSSEAEVHEASNALKGELYRVWQTAQPADEAWLVLEARPPSAFSEMEIVNGGAALVEVFGMPDDSLQEGDGDEYIMLLSAQQLMSTKDVINKANRNRSFTYSCSNKLSQLAAQHRWKQIKLLCRQPFGSEEQKMCIGLSRLSFKLCKTSAEVAADAAEANLQQNLKAGLAELFPKGSSSKGCGVVSQVTEPSRPMQACTLEHEVGINTSIGESENLSPLRGKRKLPVWQSPSKHTNKGDIEVDAGHGVLSNDEGKEIKGRQKKKSTHMPQKKEPATPTGKKSNSSVPIKHEDKEVKVQSQKSSEQGKSEGSPHKIFKGPSSQSTEGSERCGREGSSRPGPNQHSKGPPLQSRKGSELRTTEGSSRAHPHQDLQSKKTNASADEPESSRTEPSVIRGHGKKEETQSKSPLSESNKRPLESSSRTHGPSQTNAITLSFSKFLDGVVFAISGLVNPERADIRDKALQMGGQYRPDWSSDCTLLICAFANTPKFNQVKKDNGTIVSKVWIQECHQRKELVEIEKYLMHVGKPWRENEASTMDELDDESLSMSGHETTMTLASLQEVQQWVCKDVASSIAWLKQQEIQPEAEELKSVAIQGIQLCLDDTIDCLKNKQCVKKIMESWDFVPWAVQQLAKREEKAGNVRKKKFWSDMLCEAERLKWIYSKELEKMMRTEESVSEQLAKKHGKQKVMDDEDDAATDVMTDDLLSDDTQVLDEDDIREAEEAISKLLSGQRRM
eukprot:c7879_g1_i1 orf=125-2368(-)